MKDEANGLIGLLYIGFLFKMYTFPREEYKSVKKSKGVNSNALKIILPLITTWIVYKIKTKNGIESYAHNVYIVEQTKVSLNPFDHKRSHYSIETQYCIGNALDCFQ